MQKDKIEIALTDKEVRFMKALLKDKMEKYKAVHAPNVKMHIFTIFLKLKAAEKERDDAK